MVEKLSTSTKASLEALKAKFDEFVSEIEALGGSIEEEVMEAVGKFQKGVEKVEEKQKLLAAGLMQVLLHLLLLFFSWPPYGSFR